MDFNVFSNFFDTIDGLSDLISMCAEFFSFFPKIFTNAWSWLIILFILGAVFSVIWHSLS